MYIIGKSKYLKVPTSKLESLNIPKSVMSKKHFQILKMGMHFILLENLEMDLIKMDKIFLKDMDQEMSSK